MAAASSSSGGNTPRRPSTGKPTDASRIATAFEEVLSRAAGVEEVKADVTSVKTKLRAVRTHLGRVTGTQLRDHALLTDPKLENGLPYAYQLIGALGENVALLNEALKQGQIGGRKSFAQALMRAKVDERQLKTALAIHDEAMEVLGLDDDALFAELTTGLMALYARVDGHEERLNEHGRRLNAAEGTLEEHGVRLGDIEDAIGPGGSNVIGVQREIGVFSRVVSRYTNHAENEFAAIARSTRLPNWVWPVAAVVGVGVGLWVGFATNTAHGPVKNTAGTVIGKSSVNIHGGVIGVMSGIAAALLVLVVGALVFMRYTRRHFDFPVANQAAEEQYDAFLVVQAQAQANSQPPQPQQPPANPPTQPQPRVVPPTAQYPPIPTNQRQHV